MPPINVPIGNLNAKSREFVFRKAGIVTELPTAKIIPTNLTLAAIRTVLTIISSVTTKNAFLRATYVIKRMIAETDLTNLRKEAAAPLKKLVRRENGNVRIWKVEFVLMSRKSVMTNLIVLMGLMKVLDVITLIGKNSNFVCCTVG